MTLVMTKLKNGSSEPEVLVLATMLALQNLLRDHAVAFYELTMLCRDRDHMLFGNANEVLARYSLIEPSGSVHASIRNIVLSAVSGDGLDMTLQNPRQESTP